MRTFSWGVIAPGRIAQRFAACFAAIDDARVLAVASSNRERGDAFAQRFGCERVYGDYRELAQDPDIDAIYIANPHRYHLETALLCIDAGKPVLCEKPLTVSAGQAQRLMDAASNRNVFLMEALWTRFIPVWRQVKQWVDAGAIGDVVLMDSRFGYKAERVKGDRVFERDLAGGALLDIGIYNLSMSQFVMGRDPVSFVCDGVVGETGVDERVSAILNYGGPASQFTCNLLSNTDNGFRIYGSKGRIEIPADFWEASTATLITHDGACETFDGPLLANGFEYQVMHAMARIRAGELQSDVIPWRDTLATQTLMDAILARLGVIYPFLAQQ
ncbi:predicted dehydrogenase and related protein [Hahella chejuensis KCTC 2396]|uniref:Predicted dehydrogenase and related protein n=1 Tax=Hahella chejuensis (strain KCTC 2396) TaxID=349521 RepID=Q2SJ21_HAHCH|nr:Gfo/Idh/MocA family oxidoreductase [Hahella chejuensis]ABC29353.1 predicted dehydrogenase and related protein [Hahella chejuensis KCTC 2396]